MKCPYCGSEFVGERRYCPNCKQPLSSAPKAAAPKPETSAPPQPEKHTWQQKLLIGLSLFLCLILLCFAMYKVVFWISNYQIQRLYTRGEYTPTINTVVMDDGRQGHTIVFYGEDGDQIFLPEIEKSLIISGGIARITLPDSDWFTGDVSEIESANVFLTPILIDERGMRTQLPGMDLEIEVPNAPLQVIRPETDGENIITSHYQLELQVVPGSTVLINGENVTDMVSRSGLLSQNVNVYPIGDNIITVLVQTPMHHETRREITLFRKVYDIEIELDSTVSTISRSTTSTIKGHVEPGAAIAVDSPYIEDSLYCDPNTGEFSFIAKLPEFGKNDVRFRATMDGREDASVTMAVEYRPTEANYSEKAWAMDYTQLCRLYEQWHGKVFKCDGTVVESYEEEGISYFVMQLNAEGDGEPQYLILQNISENPTPAVGSQGTAFADVKGRSMYKDKHYPELIARFIYF